MGVPFSHCWGSMNASRPSGIWPEEPSPIHVPVRVRCMTAASTRVRVLRAKAVWAAVRDALAAWGTAMTASTPRITTTMSTSTSVNPRWLS